MYEDENLLYFNKGSGDALLNCSGMGILNIDFEILILMIHLIKMILILLFVSDFWPGILSLENAKDLKKVK